MILYFPKYLPLLHEFYCHIFSKFQVFLVKYSECLEADIFLRSSIIAQFSTLDVS
jgi:hypothetical protein